MAKSKKALKALKRRKEAQKRSRVVKERQDYRIGGRVKASEGLGIPDPQQQVQTNQNQEDTALAARRAELQRLGTIGMDTDGDGNISPAERNIAIGAAPPKTPEQLKSEADARAKTAADKAAADAKALEQKQLAEQVVTKDDGIPPQNKIFTGRNDWGERAPTGSFLLDTFTGVANPKYMVKDPQGNLSLVDTLQEAQSLSGSEVPFTGVSIGRDVEVPVIIGGGVGGGGGSVAKDPTSGKEEEDEEEPPETTRPVVTIGFDGNQYPHSAAAEEANARLLEESPFDYSDINIPLNSKFGSEVKYIRINDGTGNRKVAVPWFNLTNAQQQALINIYNNYPNPNQETDRAIDAYKYLNEVFGLKPETVEDEDEEEEDYLDEDAPPIEPIVGDPVEGTTGLRPEEIAGLIYSFSFSSYEDLSPRPLRKDYTDKRGKAGYDAYKEAVNRWNQGRNWWNSKSPEQRRDYFQAIPAQQLMGGVSLTGEGGTLVFPLSARRTQTGAGGTEGGIKGQVGDPAQDVLDRVYDENTREGFKVDGPEAFTTKTTPQLGTQLTGRTIDEIEDVGQQDVTTTSIDQTVAPFTTAPAQQPLKTSTMEAYSQAEANYLDKYPEVIQEMADGGYDNVFQYHVEVGWRKGRSLQFDTTKIAKSEFNRLAGRGKVELTETKAAARDTEAEEEALADDTVEFVEDLRSQVDPVTGNTVLLSSTPDAEKQTRKAITDQTAASGTEAIIQGEVGYEASQRRVVKGEAAKGEAVSFLEDLIGTGVDPIPEGISEAILDDPATVTAQVDNQPADVQAAIAALPNEALVSVQLENLLAGIDEGQTPPWARPAVQLVESRLAARGLSVSTVGRDALFNSIIQTALPIAQSNATALQQRATQNLSNQQQANLQKSAQEMQLRLTNLANRKDAASQTAQLAQQINLTQGQLTQQAVLTESQERQQVRLASLQNEQQAAMSNLGNDQQIELANLQVEAERLGANQTAENQERLAEMQVAANFLTKNEEFKQQMELANLSNEQQMRLAFLTAKNQAESQNLTTAQQTELANLSKTLETNKISAGLAQQMGLAQLNVDQQTAIRNATTVANIDMAKFTTEQQIELANSKFMQTATLQDLNNKQQAIIQDAATLAAMDMQYADNITKASIENARNFLQKDLAELNVTQQAYMLDSQQRQQRLLTATASENAANQFNATSQNQTDQFMANLGQQLNIQNAAQSNAMAQFNASEANRIAAMEAGNDLDASKLESQINSQIDQFNTQIEFQRDQWNEQNSQAVEQSNVNWRRQVNMAETAAQNAANQLQAQQLFQLSQQEQAFLWQQLRDEATYYRQQYENEQQRKTTLYATALANETEHSVRNYDTTFSQIAELFASLGTSGT